MSEIGPQRAAPKSVAAINAEVKQARRQLGMTDRELDAWIDREVFGHFVVMKCGIPMRYVNESDSKSDNPFVWQQGVPGYSTVPAADYRVLCKVRDEWDANQKAAFSHWFQREWHDRARLLSRPGDAMLMYQPGDNSRAAKAAVEAREE